MMGVPLISRDAVIGVLFLYSRKIKAYTDRDLKLAEAIGAQIAGVIANAQFFLERKRAEEALQRSQKEAIRLAQENAVMAEIGRVVSSTLNIEQVYESFAAEARKLIPFDRIAVSLNNRGEETATITYASGVEFKGKRIGDVFPLTRSGSEEVLRTRAGFLIQPEAIEELEGRFPGLIPTFQAGLRSMILVPLISRDKVIGVLHLRSKEAKAYTERDLRLAERIANQISGAIANAQLVQERKRAEEVLRESEERFRDLYDSAPVGYHEYDTEGRITNVNRTDLEMLGYSREEMIGQYIWKFNVEEDMVRQQVLEKLQGLRPPGRSLERIYRRKDGTTFPILFEDRLNQDEQGRITGIRCTIQDITERKRAEEALAKREAEAMRLAQENAVMAEIGRIISSSLNTDEVYEFFAEEVRKVIPFDRMSVNTIDQERNTATMSYVTGMTVRERGVKTTFPLAGSLTAEGVRTREGIIFHPQNEDEVAGRFPSLQSTFRSGLRSMMMVPLISQDHTIGVLHFMALQPQAYTPDDLRLALRVGNQIAGAMANAQLFSEQKRMEKALKESETKFRDLYDNAPLGYHEYDYEGRITNVNLTDLKMMGYTAEEMIGQFMWNFNIEGESKSWPS
jgi:PAS domain S-box-containing protein